MSNQHNILVKDSCIIIDLIELDLIDLFLSLGYQVYTTEAVVIEITDDNQRSKVENIVDSSGLLVDDNFDIDEINNIYNSNPSLSFTDATVIELSLRIGGILLTSDGAMRKYAESNQREVHGVLWVIELLCNVGLIDSNQAISKIETLMNINQRIPRLLCKELISKLEY